MSTSDARVNIFLKKFLTQQEITENFFDFLNNAVLESFGRVWGGDGIFEPNIFSTNLFSSSLIDTFDLITPLIGTDGSPGHILNLDPLDASEIDFENASGVDYFVGLRFSEVPTATEINVRTGEVKFRLFSEFIGELAEPDSVADDGDGTMTLVVDSVTEAGVDNSGRTVRVWLKDPVSEAEFFEERPVVWDGSNNTIETTAALGQDISSISTDSTDYQVLLRGPSVKRGTDLRLDPDILFLGIVEGAGAGSSPTTFDQSDANNFSSGFGGLTSLFGTEHDLVTGLHNTVTLEDDVGGVQLSNQVDPTDEDTPDSPLTHTLFSSTGGSGIQSVKWRLLSSAGDPISFFDAHGNLYAQKFAALESTISTSLTVDGDTTFGDDINTDVININAVFQSISDMLFVLDSNNDGTGHAFQFFNHDTTSPNLIAQITEDADILTSAASNYSLADATPVSVDASLNEVFDQTRSRDLLNVIPNNPNDTLVNIAAGRVTIANGSDLGILNSDLDVIDYAGGTIDFATGTVTGGGSNFTPFTPGTASHFFKYGVSLNSANEIEIIAPTGNAATRSGAPEPTFTTSTPIASITVQDNGSGGSGTIENLSEQDLLIFKRGAGGGGGASEESTAVGGAELVSTLPGAEIQDDFVDTPDGTTTTDISAGTTDASIFDGPNKLFRLSYDASKTVTGTGTSMTLSAAPAFTVQVGDFLVVSGEARRITALGSINSDGGSGTPFTIDSAFSSDPSAEAANVSQAWYSVDLNQSGFGGESVATVTSSATFNEILTRYQDSETLNDIIPDVTVTPHVQFIASSDGTNFSDPRTRVTLLTSTETSLILPTSGTNLFIRMFANKTSGSGAVNLLSVGAKWHV